MCEAKVVTRIGNKRKTIVKILEGKIREWLESIDDEDVRAAIRRDVIITGGSIASMLLGEKVNDYDVYFRTKATTELVAKYYVHKFNLKNGIEVGDGVNPIHPHVRVTDDRVKIFIQSAGVAAAGHEGTYQYFEQHEETVQDEYLDEMKKSMEVLRQEDEKKTYAPIFLSENAITLSNKMQIVARFYGEPEEIHNNYDFAHAMNYYDYAKEGLVLKTEALECLLSRTLIYRGSLYPVCSLFRVRKFINRGWRISAGQILKIAFQISDLDLKNPDVLREQLVGVDYSFFFQLLNALKDVDLNTVDSAYIAEIIDRVFSEN